MYVSYVISNRTNEFRLNYLIFLYFVVIVVYYVIIIDIFFLLLTKPQHWEKHVVLTSLGEIRMKNYEDFFI
jgi:hypothetical protein